MILSFRNAFREKSKLLRQVKNIFLVKLSNFLDGTKVIKPFLQLFFFILTPKIFCRYLALNIPQNPLYKDEAEKSVIPHIPIYTLLKKYDGETPYEGKIYKIRKLPKFLIFQLERFTKNNFFLEKNPTIVSFPLNNLDLKNCKSLKFLGKINFFSISQILIWICKLTPKLNTTFWRIFAMKENQKAVFTRFM